MANESTGAGDENSRGFSKVSHVCLRLHGWRSAAYMCAHMCCTSEAAHARGFVPVWLAARPQLGLAASRGVTIVVLVRGLVHRVGSQVCVIQRRSDDRRMRHS